MQNLSTQVLSKIQNLLTEIDSSKKKSKQKRKREVHEIAIFEAKAKTKIQPFNFTNKQHKKREQRIQQLYQEQKAQQKYKITNKRTLSILKKNNYTPIHERSQQILTKRKMKRQMKQLEKIQHQIQSMQPEQINYDEYEYQIGRKMTQRQMLTFRNEVDQKNQERLKKKHIKQLSRIDRSVYCPIPKIIKLSKSLSLRHNVKNSLSFDVFQRLGQDYIDRQKRKNSRLLKYTQQQGGFRPIINDYSRQLAQRSRSSRSLVNIKQSQHHKRCKQRKIFIKTASSKVNLAQKSQKDKKDKNKQKKQVSKTLKDKQNNIPITFHPQNKSKTSKKTEKRQTKINQLTPSKNKNKVELNKSPSSSINKKNEKNKSLRTRNLQIDTQFQ